MAKTGRWRKGKRKGFKLGVYSAGKGAVKLHTLFSFNDFLPMDVFVSDGKMSDNDGAYHVLPGRRSIVVADRDSDDSALWRAWDSRESPTLCT